MLSRYILGLQVNHKYVIVKIGDNMEKTNSNYKQYESPFSGATLESKENGLFYDKYTKQYFKLDENNKLSEVDEKGNKVYEGPFTGAPMKMNENGLYHDRYSGQYFKLDESNKLFEVDNKGNKIYENPTTGAPMKMNENGLYHDKYSGQYWTEEKLKEYLNKRKEEYIKKQTNNPEKADVYNPIINKIDKTFNLLNNKRNELDPEGEGEPKITTTVRHF